MESQVEVQQTQPEMWTCFGSYTECEVCDSICFQSTACKESSVMPKKATDKQEIDNLLEGLTDGDKPEGEGEEQKAAEYAEGKADGKDAKKETKGRKAAAEPKAKATKKKKEPKPVEPEKTATELIDEHGSYFTAPFKETPDLQPIAVVLRDGICPHTTKVTERGTYIKIDSKLVRMFMYFPSARRKETVRIELKNESKYDGKFKNVGSNGNNIVIDLESADEAVAFVEAYTGESFEADAVPTTLTITDMLGATAAAIKDGVLDGESSVDEVKAVLTTAGIYAEQVASVDESSLAKLLESAKEAAAA